jgi:SAM-dependent methyltransferase
MASRLSVIAHTHHKICSPLSETSVRSFFPLIETLLSKRPEADTEPLRCADLGCGKAGVLALLAEFVKERCPTNQMWHLSAVDASAEMMDSAQKAMPESGKHVQAFFHNQKVQDYFSGDLSGKMLDLAICIGSTHSISDTIPAALACLRSHVASSGALMFGDVFWKRVPDAALATSSGIPVEAIPSFDELLALIDSSDWLPVYLHTSTDQEWESYEWLYQFGLLQQRTQMPEVVPFAAAARERYLRLGREHFGFAVFLLVPRSL